MTCLSRGYEWKSAKILALASTLTLATAPLAFGFENTKILPKGIRNVTIKSVRTSISEKTDADGNRQPLGKPLSKDLTFARVVNGESGLKREQLKALLLSEGIEESESLGEYEGVVEANVSVVAPIFAYGVTDSITVAVAVPYYQAHSVAKVGFHIGERGQYLVDRLHNPEINQTTSSQDVAGKLNNAVGRLNDKLVDNGYAALGEWQGSGLGDITVAMKAQIASEPLVKVASSSGVVLPTGREASPDIMTDIPFGEGSTGIFSSMIVDEPLGAGFVLNEYVKYTYMAPGKRDVRMATDAETIEVEKYNARYKRGDKVEAGLSVQYEPDFGLVAGLGYAFYRKLGDTYELSEYPDTKSRLQRDTHERTHHWETRIGYSGIQAYRDGKIPVPFAVNLDYKRHVASVNKPVSDYVTLDAALYF